MIDLRNLSRDDVARCAATMQALCAGAVSLEDAARRVVQFCYESFGDPRTSCRSCALVRFFKTHPFGKLDETARSFVEATEGVAPAPGTVCLALCASAGDKAPWNVVETSVRHRAASLGSDRATSCFPILVPLVTGLERDPSRAARRPGEGRRVAFVPEAIGSPNVPDQAAFVEPCGIRSVIAFGGRLPSREVCVVILFSKVPLPDRAPRRFAALARAMTSALTPLADPTLFP